MLHGLVLVLEQPIPFNKKSTSSILKLEYSGNTNSSRSSSYFDLK